MYNRRTYGVTPRTISGLIEDVFQNGWNRVTEEVSAYSTPVNIQETDAAYDLHVVAPGLKKEDIKVNVDRNLLHISYEHKEQEENKEQQEGKDQSTTKWLRKEYKQRSFKRTFTLNEKIDAGKINAKYNDGILVISLPKKELSEQPVTEIAIN